MAMTVARRRAMPIVIFGVGSGHCWEHAQLVRPTRDDISEPSPADDLSRPEHVHLHAKDAASPPLDVHPHRIRKRGCHSLQPEPL